MNATLCQVVRLEPLAPGPGSVGCRELTARFDRPLCDPGIVASPQTRFPNPVLTAKRLRLGFLIYALVMAGVTLVGIGLFVAGNLDTVSFFVACCCVLFGPPNVGVGLWVRRRLAPVVKRQAADTRT